VEVEGGRQLMAYQAKDWYTTAVVFIETTADVDFDIESETRTKVA
jgi:hypothetical protein